LRGEHAELLAVRVDDENLWYANAPIDPRLVRAVVVSE